MDETKTVLDAKNQTARFDIGKHAGGTFTVPQTNIMTTVSNSAVLGFDINGNVIYHHNGGSMMASDLTGTQVTLEDSGNTRNIGNTQYTDQSKISTRRFKRISSAEQTALNLPVPSFGIQLLGVKSTV